MENTILIQVKNEKALRLLYELEELQLIKVLKKNLDSEKTKLSEKYKGVFSKEDAKSFEKHTQKMRGEWKIFNRQQYHFKLLFWFIFP